MSRFLFPILLGFILPLLAQADELPVVDSLGNSDAPHSLEQQTFLLVNQYRKANKLPPFEWNNDIAKVARGHSKDMASGEVDFGHDGFSKRVADLKTLIIGLHGAGENVLKTDDPEDVAKKAVDLWLHSPHHLKNIRGDYNYSGMGVWQKDGTIYFTQLFVKTLPPAKPAPAPPPPQVVSPYNFLAPPSTR